MLSFHLRRFLTSSLLFLAVASAIHAQVLWNADTGNWSTGSNWSPALVPESDMSASLSFGGSADYTTTNDIGNFSLNQLRFNNTAGTVTLNGAPATNILSFVNDSSNPALPVLQLTGGGSASVATPVNWDGNTTVTNSGSGTLLFNGTQTYTVGTKHTFINDGAGTITLADGITYASSGNGVVLNLINNNTTAGTFNVGDMGALAGTFNIGGTGVVSFAGTSADDLFGGSAVLNVLSGGTFDFNGNGETFGALSGAGTIRSTVGLSTSLVGSYEFSGKLTGVAGALTVGGATQTLTLSGSESDYTGVTAVTAGRMIVSANAPKGSAGALGNATSEVLVGATSGANLASLLIDTAGVTIGRDIRLQSGNTGVVTVGGLNTSGTVTYGGNLTLGTNAGVGKTVTLLSTTGGIVSFTGNLVRATGGTGVTDALSVTGGGTVALRGTNTFTGTTTVAGGTLLLDYGTNNTNKVSSTAALILNGGSLSIAGNAGAATTQTVNGLTLGNSAGVLGGGARISVVSGVDRNVTLNVGAITRNTGATVNFGLTNSGTGVANVTTTTANNAAGIMGGYATFGLNDWAVNSGGNVAGLGAGSYANSFGAGSNTSVAANTVLPSGGATAHTLRFTAAAAVTFNATPGALTLESGGLLVASGSGATSIGTTSLRGTLTSSTGEVIVHQQSTTGTLTINSVITGTNLTKTGNGNLTLTGTNTYTGNTIINGGTVTVTAAVNLGATNSDVFINGATLALPSGTIGTLAVASRVITIGPAGATFNFGVVQGFEGSGLAGSGNLTLTGAGGISVGSSLSTFSGNIFINNGILRIVSNQFQSVQSISVASGGTYNVEDDGTGSFSIATGGRFYLNGNGFNNLGAMRLSDQTGGTSKADPRTTIDREIVLQTTSKIQVDPGTAAGSVAQLSLTNKITGDGGLIKSGAGVLVLSNRDNTYAGDTAIQGGTLRINLGNDRLPVTTKIILGTSAISGNLQLNGYSQTVAGLSTSGIGNANSVTNGSSLSSSLLTVNVASGSQVFNGSLGGVAVENNHVNNDLGLIKAGAGSLFLGRAGSYDGMTSVVEGSLVLGHANALGNGGSSLASGNAGTTVQAGATLDLNGQFNVQEVITLNGTGVGGGGALVNNSSTPSSIGNGIASLSVSSVTPTGWTAGSSSVSVGLPNNGTGIEAAPFVMVDLALTADSFALTSGGTGFGLAPVVTVSGSTGAVVTANVGVTSTSFTIAPPVLGTTTSYSTPPTVTLQNGATGVAVLDANGYVVGINVTSPGTTSFVATPTATFAGGTVQFQGTNPTAVGNVTNFTVTGLNIVNAGTGFSSEPTITIGGGTGTGAMVVGNDSHFALNGFTVNENGYGYNGGPAPAVTVSGGSAAVTANQTAIKLGSDSSIGGSGELKVEAVISGGYGLTKVGTGTTILTGVNTYTGNTMVSGGTLQVGLTGVGSVVGDVTATSSAFSSATTVSGVRPGNVGVTGQVRITGAPVIAGSGFIAGNVVVGTNATSVGVLKPGDPDDTTSSLLRIGGNLTVNGGSQIQLGLASSFSNDPSFNGLTMNAKAYLDSIFGGGNGTKYVQYWKTASGEYDALDVNGTITLGSGGAGSNLPTILVGSESESSYAEGDIFKLLDWSTVGTAGSLAGGGGFDINRDLVLPDLSSWGLAWDTSAFTTYGSIVVVVVPEPSRALLLVGGLLALGLRRRRSVR